MKKCSRHVPGWMRGLDQNILGFVFSITNYALALKQLGQILTYSKGAVEISHPICHEYR